jgi:hypothetical protein
MRFRHLSAGERALFWVAVVLTAACNVAALVVGYSLALHFVESTGVFDPKTAKLFPVLGDTVLLVAETSLIYLWMMRQRVPDPTAINRGPVIAVMAVAVGVTLAAVEMRAGHSWAARILVASAPLLAFGLFNVLLSVVKATLLALGRHPSTTTVIQGSAIEVGTHLGTSTRPQDGQTGQLDLASRKAELARLICRSKTTDQLSTATDSSVRREVRDLFDVDIDRGWAGKALSDVRTERNGSQP